MPEPWSNLPFRRCHLNPLNRKHSILVIDDDTGFCKAVKDALAKETVSVLMAHCGADGLALCKEKNVAVVLLDQKLPDGVGWSFCRAILEQNDRSKIIFVTAYPSYANAVEAIKNGAYDYLSKPMELDELRLAVQRSLKAYDLEGFEEIRKYKQGKKSSQIMLVGEDGDFAETSRLVNLMASSDIPVLITGETGVGKNVVAKAIHYRGANGSAPFVSVNCAALPENLIEAELFGYEKGAYTGADHSRKGVFEMADGGTVFLDEVGELSLNLQSKLLCVLEDRTIKKIGGTYIRPVDIRVIAATNLNIEDAVRSRRFREDLFYRLNVMRIHVPPLRERKADIKSLCCFFLQQAMPNQEALLSEDEISSLTNYNWPGNVRELKNIIERAVVLREGSHIRPSRLLGSGSVRTSYEAEAKQGSDQIPSLKDVEKQHIARVFNTLSGNVTQTARSLGIALNTLKRKLKEHGIRASYPI